MDLKFYKCMHCGNIAIKPFDAGVPLVCCGEKMTELTANTTDAAVEKHVRGARRRLERARRGGQHAASHTPEHYITFICLVTKNATRSRADAGGCSRRRLRPLPKAMRLSRCTSTATCRPWVAEV